MLAAFVTPLKLSRRCLKLWRDVLERIPRAWLAFSPLEPALRPCYERLARAAGLPLDRIVFLPAARDEAGNLARYAVVDAVLDPTPFGNVNGVLEPLQAGVPVVTLLGRRHGERSAYTILAHAGVDGTVAQSGREYVDIVARLAGDAAFREGVVATIRAGMASSPLVDLLGAHPGPRARVPRRARRTCARGAGRQRLFPGRHRRPGGRGRAARGARGGRGRMTDPRLADADGLLAQRRHDAARELLDALLGAPSPAPADRRLALLLRAEAHQGLRNPAAAVADLRGAIALEPRDPKPHNALGIALADAGDGGGAIAAFRRAVELDPGYARAWNNLGNALRDGGRAGEALAAFQRAVAVDPDYALAWTNLAAIAREQGDDPAAEQAFRRALAAKPDQRSALTGLAAVLRTRGDVDEAASLYGRAGELDPRDPAPLLQRAGCLAERDDLDGARGAYVQARARRPSSLRAALGEALTLPMVYLSAQHVADERAALRLGPGTAGRRAAGPRPRTRLRRRHRRPALDELPARLPGRGRSRAPGTLRRDRRVGDRRRRAGVARRSATGAGGEDAGCGSASLRRSSATAPSACTSGAGSRGSTARASRCSSTTCGSA